MNGLKVSVLTVAAGLGLTYAGTSSAALVGSNLGFETTGQAPAPWQRTGDTGTDPMEDEDFRTAADPDNWFPDSGAGNNVQLLEADNANESGTYGQQLTGTAEAGTYTWALADVGVTNFADNVGAILTYGFSLDGTTFIAGSSQTLVEGTDIFSPDNNTTGVFNGSVSYVASGAETQLWLLFSRDAGHTGRSTVSVGSTALDFAPVPEPGSLALMGLGGLLIARRRRG